MNCLIPHQEWFTEDLKALLPQIDWVLCKTSMACGRTWVGTEPAEETVTPFGANARAMPSAIWLLAEFATQRKRKCLGASARSTDASSFHRGGGRSGSEWRAL